MAVGGAWERGTLPGIFLPLHLFFIVTWNVLLSESGDIYVDFLPELFDQSPRQPERPAGVKPSDTWDQHYKWIFMPLGTGYCIHFEGNKLGRQFFYVAFRFRWGRT